MQPTFDEMMGTAQTLHRAGKWEDAEKIYKDILKTQPGHIGALISLGLSLF